MIKITIFDLMISASPATNDICEITEQIGRCVDVLRPAYDEKLKEYKWAFHIDVYTQNRCFLNVNFPLDDSNNLVGESRQYPIAKEISYKLFYGFIDGWEYEE